METTHTGAFPLLALLSSCIGPVYTTPATDRSVGSRELIVEGTYLHEASGTVFPETVAGCPRGRIVAYSETADDVGVTYDSGDPVAKIFATIYVYPRHGRDWSPRLKDHFQAVVAEIQRHHPGATPGPIRQVTVDSKGARGHGLTTSFGYETRIDFVNEAVTSSAFLFSCGDWFVKYRITYPRSQEAHVHNRVDAFLKTLEWPEA